MCLWPDVLRAPSLLRHSKQCRLLNTQPASQMIECGSGVTFTVSASGAGPLSYQWRLNTTDIPDAMNSTYNIPIVSSGGSYTVAVTDADGTTVSDAAVLTVADTT